MYLDGIQDFRVVNGRRRAQARILRAPSLQDSVVPVSGMSLAVPERVDAQSLLPAFMPGSFVSVAIGELVHSVAVHFVRKVLSSVRVPVSEPTRDKIP